MIAVGDDVGVVVEGEDGRESLDSLDHVAADHDPAPWREVVGEEEPQPVELPGDHQPAPEVRKRDAAPAAVGGLGVGDAAREVEFLFRGVDVDPVVGLQAVVDLPVGDREVAHGLDRDVVRPEHRVAPPVDLVHRRRDDSVTVGVFQRQIHPDLRRGRQLGDVELAGGDHHLPLGAVHLVAVEVDAAEGVVGAEALGLLQLRLERAPVPDARIAQGGGAVVEVLASHRRLGDGEFLFVDVRAFEPVGPPGARDAARQVGLFEGDLVGSDVEALDDRGEDLGAQIEGGEDDGAPGPAPPLGEDPGAQARPQGDGRERDGGAGPGRDDHQVGRQPEVDVDPGRAGDDAGVAVDDQAKAREEA